MTAISTGDGERPSAGSFVGTQHDENGCVVCVRFFGVRGKERMRPECYSPPCLSFPWWFFLLSLWRGRGGQPPCPVSGSVPPGLQGAILRDGPHSDIASWLQDRFLRACRSHLSSSVSWPGGGRIRPQRLATINVNVPPNRRLIMY